MDGPAESVDAGTRRLRDRVEAALGLERAAGDLATRGQLVARELTRRIGDAGGAAAAPRVVGRYVLGERLGRGGMGVVHAARHAVTNHPAAVKLAPRRDEVAAEALRAEARALARIDAPNVLRVLDAGETDEVVWMATPLVKGESLEAFLRRRRAATPQASEFVGLEKTDAQAATARPASPAGHAPSAPFDRRALRRVMTWFRDLALALDELHRAGLVHRDVKPANVIIDEQDRPVLIDLGLAFDAGDVAGGLAGTLRYMSPEQTFTAWARLTGASDLYGLAVTFHEVLTGRPVVSGARLEALRQIAFETPPAPSRCDPRLPASLDPIFARALAKNPDERFASGRELAAAVEAWRRAEVRRPRRVVLAGLGLLAAILVAVATQALRPHPATAELAALIDRRDVQNAMSFAAAHDAERRDDEAFVRLRDHAIDAAAPQRTRALLADQSFAVSLSGRRTTRQLFGEDARAFLPHRADEHLIFQAAFDELLEHRRDAARRRLDRHAELVRASSLLQLLDALVCAAEGDFDRARAAFARGRRDPHLHPDEGLALEALLFCWRHGPRRLGTAAEIAAVEARVTGRLDELVATLGPDRVAERRLLRTMRARLRFDLGRFADALRDLDVLLEDPSSEPERIGILGFAAVGAVMLEVDDPGAIADALRRTARVVEVAGEGALDWMARQLLVLQAEPLRVLAWLDGLADGRGRLLGEAPHLVQLVDLTVHAALVDAPETCARVALALPLRAGEDELADRLQNVRINGLWARVMVAEARLAAPRATADEADAAATTATDGSEPDPAAARAAVAELGAAVARTAQDAFAATGDRVERHVQFTVIAGLAEIFAEIVHPRPAPARARAALDGMRAATARAGCEDVFAETIEKAAARVAALEEGEER